MIRSISILWLVFVIVLSSAFSATIPANFTSATTIPVTATSYIATGNDVSLSLAFAPVMGTNLTVVKNTGIGFIIGQFSNLSQGESVNLSHNGVTYKYVANYYGGSGNDLVLQWPWQDLAAWGGNSSGQLGNGSTINSRIPVLVSQSGVLAGKTVVSVAAGDSHSLALCSDGTVAAWGSNSSGQLGNDKASSSSVPVLVTQNGVLAGKTVVSVATGPSHSLALCSDGTLAAWGSNSSGQLGNGTTANCKVPVLVTRSGALSGKTVVSLSARGHFSLALCSDGTLAAWGSNWYGQLGNNSWTDSSVPVLVTQSGVLSGKTVVSLSAGGLFSLALCSDGTLAAWGYNKEGQLGNGSSTSCNIPVLVTRNGVLSGKTVVSAVANGSHSMALCSDGTLTAWGYNVLGQLGNNSWTNSSEPVLVTQSGVLSGKTVVSLAGLSHSLALCSDGTLAAWGYNYYGQLGNGTTANSKVPVLVTQNEVLLGKSGVSVSAGFEYSLVLSAVQNSSDLSCLSLSSGILSPLFEPSITSYYTSIAYANSAITIKPTSIANCGKIFVNNNPVNSNSMSQELPMAVGANTVSILVTAPDGMTTRTYTITVTRLPISRVSTLSDLTLSSGTLSPSIASDNTSYSASVVNAVTSIIITPTVTDETASMKVNGTTVASGSASASIPLSVGLTTITIVVTAEVGATTSIYTISIERPPSSVSTLSGLVLSNGTLSPAFTFGTASYAAAVANTTTTVTIRPTVSDATAIVKVDGTTVASGTNSTSIPLSVGPNTITTSVTAQDGTTTSSYTVVVTRAPSAIAMLSNLLPSSGTLSPTFASTTTAYAVTVNAKTLAVTPTATDSTSTVRVNGDFVPSGASSALIPLSLGANTITAVVTAQDGVTTKNYTLMVTRLSTVSDLSALSLNTGILSPAFSQGTTAYASEVSNTTTTINVTPTLTDTRATVRVNGTMVASGNASVALPLAAGSNTITVLVTAEDGTTTTTHTITVTRVYLEAVFTSVTTVPIQSSSYNVTGNSVNLTLAYAPSVGTHLTVVRNTGLDFINGRFSNLAQGQVVSLSYNNDTYRFVANYFGGTGNDVVLQWADNRAYTWGSNSLGQLGDNDSANSSLPVAVATSGVLGNRTILSVAVGSSHSVALCSNGTIAAWGNATYGQLGDGTNNNSNVPVTVTANGVLSGQTVVAVAAGFNHSLALCADGTVVAWGMNSAGQLGNGTNNSSNVPVAVTKTGALLNKTVVAIAAGYNHSLARCADGTVVTWGNNAYGQLGNNSTTNTNVPVDITTSGELYGRTVIFLVGGSDHSIGLCSDGSLVSWGRNNYGQLGNNSTVNSSVPVVVDASDVLAGEAITAIATGGWHTLALCSDGTLAAFGRNNNGQLGNNSTADSNVPVNVITSGILANRTITAIGGSNAHSLALCSDGTLASWGSNNVGQLGNNSTTGSGVPVEVSWTTLGSGMKFTDIATGSSASHVMTLAAFNISSNSTLSGLTISSGTLNPAFDSATTDYTVGFPNLIASVTITPVVSEANATVKVNGTTVTSGTASATIPLFAGINTLTVDVTAQNGITCTSYVLTSHNGSYAVWKASEFTAPGDLNDPAISGEMAMPAHDGITNLMKHALALAPMTCGTADLPTVALQDGYLTLTYRKNKTANDVIYTVQASDSLTANGWSPATTVLSQKDEGDYWLVTVQDTVPQVGHSCRFMCLRVRQ